MRDYTMFVMKDCSSERKRDRQTDGQRERERESCGAHSSDCPVVLAVTVLTSAVANTRGTVVRVVIEYPVQS